MLDVWILRINYGQKYRCCMYTEYEFGSFFKGLPNKNFKREDVDPGRQIKDKRCTGTKKEKKNHIMKVVATSYRQNFLYMHSCRTKAHQRI